MHSTKHIATVAAGVAAVLWTAPSAFAQTYAQAPGFYLGGGYTFMTFEGDNGIDAEVGGITGRAGWQFNNWLSIEGDGTFGFEDGDFTFDGTEDEFNLDDNSDGDVADIITAPGDFGVDYMFGGFVKASFPLGAAFDISGRLGYSFAEVDSTVTTPGGGTIDIGDSETGVSYGAGVAWHFNEHHSVRGDYTYTDFDLAEVDAFGLVYEFKF
jgi:hypothetical protein